MRVRTGMSEYTTLGLVTKISTVHRDDDDHHQRTLNSLGCRCRVESKRYNDGLVNN